MKDFIDISDKRLRFLKEIAVQDLDKMFAYELFPFDDEQWVLFYKDIRRACPCVNDLEVVIRQSQKVLSQYKEEEVDWNDPKIRRAYVHYQKGMVILRTLVVCAKRAMDIPLQDIFGIPQGDS